MASADTTVAQSTNGHGDGAQIAVENPATGEIIAHVPDLSAERVAELARIGRSAQVGWQALGFAGRVRVMRRMQKWVMDNAERIVATIVSETGKTYEDAYMAEINYAGGAFAFWTKHAEKFLADEKVRATTLAVIGKKLVVRYEPIGLVGVIGPWNYPLTNSFGDCIPALLAGNSVILKPSEITPLTSLLLAEGLRRERPARRRLPGRHRPRRDRRGARRRGRHDHVHRLDADRQEGRRRAPRSRSRPSRWSSAARTR